MEIGLTTKCMVMGSTSGGMVGSTKESTLWIESKALELTPGQMGGDMKVDGIRVNRMERENTFYLME